MKVAALLDDLFFSSKISAVARERGTTVTFGRSAAAAPEDAELILIDLETPGLDTVEAIRSLKATRTAKVVAYVSHVQADLKRRAEEAGADAVLARSAFVHLLPELLRQS